MAVCTLACPSSMAMRGRRAENVRAATGIAEVVAEVVDYSLEHFRFDRGCGIAVEVDDGHIK